MPHTIPYVRLGSSGLKVSRVILGTMTYGSPGWRDWLLSEDVALEHIKYAYEAGIQTFDTADGYSNGLSETILGNCIKKLNLPREEIVVMTKVWALVGREHGEYMTFTNPDDSGYVNQQGLSRKHIFHAVQNSLKRLQLDYVDVLQCHAFDPNTPIEETMHALHDVVKSGWARYIGMSNCTATQFHIMQNYAIQNKLTPFISMQNHYNLVYREHEREIIPTLKHFGVGSMPWSPLARGLLTRPLSKSTETTRGAGDGMMQMYLQSTGTPEIVNRVEELSKKRGVSMAQISIAWSLAQYVVAAPVVGTSSLKNLQDIIDGVHLKLTAEEITYLQEPYKAQGTIGY